MTTILRIEHRVPDYAAWKQTFDGDPLDRKGSGVRRYQVFRGTAEPNLVMIDLEFDTQREAEMMHSRLRELWGPLEGTLVSGAAANILQPVEFVEL